MDGYFSLVIVDRARSGLRRGTLAAATCAAAALLAPTGAAAEGIAPVLPQASALPDAAAVTTDAAALTDAVLELAGSTLPAAVPPEATLSDAPSPAAAPPAAEAPTESPTPDITPDAPDTATSAVAPDAQSVVSEGPAAQGATQGAVATQTRPANVNVSIRIASPGDDGAVEQVNASAADSSVAPAPDAPLTSSGPSPARPPADAAASAPARSSEKAAAGTAGAAPDTWTWNWNCGDPTTDVSSLPTLSTEVLAANWIWNWNCGESASSDSNAPDQLPGQYHVGATQYQPVNLNVSIRIASPGDNGPVVQANLAVAVAKEAGPQAPAAPAPSPTDAGLPPPPLLVPPALPLGSSGADALELVATPQAAVAAAVATVESAVASAVAFLDLDRRATPALAASDELLTLALLDVRSDRPAQLAPGRPASRRIPDVARAALVTPSDWRAPLPTVRPSLRGSTSQPDHPGAAARRSRHGKPASSAAPPRRGPLPTLPERVPVAALGLGGTAPGTGGDAGFPFLLLIPFAFALAEAARRVARDRPALLAQVESSRRERPG